MSEIMRTSSAEDIEEAGEVTSRQVKAMQAIDRWGVLFLVVIMVVIGFLLHPDIFLGERNVLNIVRQNSVIALLALGQFIVIVTAGIDLSVGSVVALAMMSAALLVDGGAPWILAFMAPFLVGLTVGIINGLGLTKLHMPHPFIMTLGMLFIVRGISYIISDGRPISGMPDEIRFLGGPGGLEIGEFLIPTHSQVRRYAETRWKEISDAFERQAPYCEEDEQYDVTQVLQRVLAKLSDA